MGLTIHYQFSLNNVTLSQAREKAIALHNFALQLPFVRVGKLGEISGDACDFDKKDVEDPHVFMKIRALKPIEIAMNGFSWQNPTHIIGV